MRLALVSLDQIWQDKDGNSRRCTEFVHQAQAYGCTLAVFPEMTLTGYSLDMVTVAEPANDSLTLVHFGNLANETGISIVFGACLFDPDTGRSRNHLCLARPGSAAEALFAKVHPFSFVRENEMLDAGDRPGTAEVGGFKLGAAVCYDLRFPELFSAMAPTCDAAVVIANWPARRVAHWRTLLIARAIENQFFAIGVNRIGMDGNGLVYEKSSMVVTPDGAVLKPEVAGEEMDIFDIDPEEVARYRAVFPTVRDKRYALYRDLFGKL